MKRITSEFGIEEVRQNIRDWRICSCDDIKTLFEQWVSKEGEILDPRDEVSSSVGALNNSDQYSRLTGIDFGKVDDEFKAKVNEIELNQDTKSTTGLTLELAVHEGVFTVFFKTTIGNEELFWGNSMGNISCLYSVAPLPKRNVIKRYGVSTDLRNQFVANWVSLPFFMVSDLFYSMSITAGDKPKPYSRNRAWVRAMRYNISGNNLTALNDLLKSGSDTQGIRLRFGANLSDIMLGEDVFTMIVEVDDEHSATSGRYVTNHTQNTAEPLDVESTSYLEFINACPPICCKPGEPDDPCQQQ